MIGDRLVAQIRCRLGKHVRSKHKVKVVDNMYRSRCRYCDAPMREDGGGGWMIDDGKPIIKNTGRLFDLD